MFRMYETMNIYFGILIVVSTIPRRELANSCGSLTLDSENVSVGDTAELIYTPNNMNAPRVWYKYPKGGKVIIIHDGVSSTNPSKYIEEKENNTFKLRIVRVSASDADVYIVRCNSTGIYSAQVWLTVTPSTETDTNCGTLSIVSNNLTEGANINLLFAISPGREIIWQREKNSTFIAMNKDDRYDIVHNKDKAVHNLFIYRSIYTDHGAYRVKCGSVFSNVRHVIIVPTPPSKPVFNLATDIYDCKQCLSAVPSVSMTVECYIDGGSDPLSFNMFKNGQSIISEVSQTIVGLYRRSTAKYTYVPGAEDFDVSFNCTVNNPALPFELSQVADLYITVDPETAEINDISVNENETSEVRCTTKKGRPPMKALIYVQSIWQREAEIHDIISINNTYSVVTTVNKTFTRQENQVNAFCCSQGQRIACNYTVVNISFAPLTVNLVETTKKNNDNGDTELALKCIVGESNPKSRVEWKGIKNVARKPTERLYGNHTATHGWTYSVVLLLNLTREDNGRTIRCEVENSAFPTLYLSASYSAYITYTPVVSISGLENRTAYIGDTVIFSCSVDSNPLSSITWRNETDEIGTTSSFKYLEVQLQSVTMDHAQVYTCSASNTIGGTITSSITLVVKDASEKAVTESYSNDSQSSVAWPVFGFVVIVVVAIIGITVFLVLRKSRQNASLERNGSQHIKVEPRKPSTKPQVDEPVYNNIQGGNMEQGIDLVEYASVVPSADRKAAKEDLEPVVNANISTTAPSEDHLVYADLDLARDTDGAARRPLVTQHEPTEYVSIDFSKTGTVTIDDNDDSCI